MITRRSLFAALAGMVVPMPEPAGPWFNGPWMMSGSVGMDFGRPATVLWIKDSEFRDVEFVTVIDFAHPT